MDDSSIPYDMKGMNSWLYDNASGESFLAGYTEATYDSRDEALRACAAHSANLAEAKKMQDWSYVCCTVTQDSDCATKVR